MADFFDKDPGDGSRDYGRLLARVFQLDESGNLHRAQIGKLVGLPADKVRVGDSWDIDGRTMRVAEVGDKHVTVELIEEGSEIPIGGDEFVYGDEVVRTYRIGKDKLLPANTKTFARADDAAESVGSPTAIQFEKRVPDLANNGIDLNFADMAVPPKETGAVGAVRFSMTGRVMRNDSGEARITGRMLAEDALAGTREGDVARPSASLWKAVEFTSRMGEWVRETTSPFTNWVKAAGKRANIVTRAEFDEQVGRATRRVAGTFVNNPEINAASASLRKRFRDMLAFGKRYGIKGFADIPERDTYVPRIHRLTALDRAVKQHGEEQMDLFWSAAVKAGSENLDDDLARVMGKGYHRNIRRIADDTQVSKSTLFSADRADDLARIIKEEVPEATGEQVDQILYRTVRDETTNTISRAKRRIDLDENFSMKMEDGTILRVEDMLENNASKLLEIYTNQIIGAAATTEVLKTMSVRAGRTLETWEALRRFLADDMRKVNVAQGKMTRDLDRLETLFKSVRGQALNERSAFSDAMHRIRQFNYLRMAGQFGWAQLADTANVIAATGYKAMLQQMPILPQLFRRGIDGKLINSFLREQEAITGLGTHGMLHLPHPRLDDPSGVLDISRNGRMDVMLARGQQFVSKWSGMEGVTVAQQRMFVTAAIQWWMNDAIKGSLPSAKRLASMGLDESMARRIHAAMKQHVTTERGLFGRQVRRVNWDEWTDKEAASNLLASLNMWARRAVQENDIGNLSLWMTKDSAKIFTQFRTFSLVAWEKQFLHGVRMHDIQTFHAFALAMLIGGLGYMGQEYVKSFGRPDRKEYVRRRLSPDAIAKAAFQRAGWSSILPPMIDQTLKMTGSQQQFAHARTSGLANDIIGGSPTIDLFGQLSSGVQAVVAPMRTDYEFSRADANALIRLTPFSNLMGIQNVANALTEPLPERSREPGE